MEERLYVRGKWSKGYGEGGIEQEWTIGEKKENIHVFSHM